jgi:hypothetical protein
MALCRCEKHGNPKKRGGGNYVRSVKPIGYPDKTSTICGRELCENPGLIWLDERETQAYEKGQRVFMFSTFTVKVLVQ